MSKFTAAELVEFYQKVDDGGVIQVNGDEDGWYSVTTSGPTVGSYKGYWRIKPAKKIIDMAHFIESGIDMEFWDDASDSYTNISILDSINVELNYAFVSKISRYKHCRPRMNHIHFHRGDECPLPEGFEVKLYWRNSDSITTTCPYTKLIWEHHEYDLDIIGYEILRLADGWAYPWEVL